ncbi:MAG: aldehyde ferredoxin oxidoreductase family protein [Chloroflexi bacterium]|nr:aldehyde ferredoxin oxidoreductase family protein [Chloroflexota bacterium]
MPDGYMGKILFVNLSTGELKDETPDENLYRDYIGSYGLGARILWDRQLGGVDPLGPENMIGFVTGPLTGVPGFFGSRYTVVGKSPLTGSWGDANSGGYFGPHLKFAGYDAVFVTGAASKPTYLLIDDGKAELKDAGHLWGKDTNETEDILRAELGKKVYIAGIGPAGEKLSLISCVINDKGRAAGRSGLGAVMGSKKLKTIAVVGTKKVPVANEEKAAQVAKEYRGKLSGMMYDIFQQYGTAAGLNVCVMIGDSPVKNWAGTAGDFPNGADISDQKVLDLVDRKYACWGCPIVCGATMKAGTQYKYEAGAHRPEYETLSSFGPMCLNDNLESIIKANDLCNRYGLDTISAGATIAFAIECYENGLISNEDTGGIELNWGNHEAIVAMTEMLANREGFGDILADGVKRAAEKIGKGAEQYAIHVGGQELPMHDPRMAPSFGGCYQTDPTPGRHTQGGLSGVEMGMVAPEWIPSLDKYTYTGKGQYEARLKNTLHTLNASGICSFAAGSLPDDAVTELIAAVTGWDFTTEDNVKIGERIANVRQAFNVREGLTPKDFKITGRPIGDPPLKDGPTANVVVDADTLKAEYFKAMDWNLETGKPGKQKLIELGLENIAEVLWP